MKYCIDTNVFIQAWQKYYKPDLCPGYWEVLNEMGREEIIFISNAVYNEITEIEDELSKWLKTSEIPVMDETEDVLRRLKEIFAFDPVHEQLVDNKRGRSLADPWVIAHAMDMDAVVVTKEERITSPRSKKITIPNVCDNMGVDVIDDFELLRLLNVSFSCAWKNHKS